MWQAEYMARPVCIVSLQGASNTPAQRKYKVLSTQCRALLDRLIAQNLDRYACNVGPAP
jgi:hypothetical protein